VYALQGTEGGIIPPRNLRGDRIDAESLQRRQKTSVSSKGKMDEILKRERTGITERHMVPSGGKGKRTLHCQRSGVLSEEEQRVMSVGPGRTNKIQIKEQRVSGTKGSQSIPRG